MVFVLFPVEGDALGALLLGDADLLDGVSGEGVGGGQQRGLGPVAELVSNEGDHGDGAVRKGEAEGESKTFKCMYCKKYCGVSFVTIHRKGISKCGRRALPVGSLHVALSLRAHHAGSLLSNAVARLEAEGEGSVSVVSALVEGHNGVLFGAGSGGGEGQQAGEHGLAGKAGSVYLTCRVQ